MLCKHSFTNCDLSPGHGLLGSLVMLCATVLANMFAVTQAGVVIAAAAPSALDRLPAVTGLKIPNVILSIAFVVSPVMLCHCCQQ